MTRTCTLAFLRGGLRGVRPLCERSIDVTYLADRPRAGKQSAAFALSRWRSALPVDGLMSAGCGHEVTELPGGISTKSIAERLVRTTELAMKRGECTRTSWPGNGSTQGYAQNAPEFDAASSRVLNTRLATGARERSYIARQETGERHNSLRE